jgi:tRNA(fMet)-specific endonuclease VapC
MSGKVLLDTNIVIALFAGEASVIEKLTVARSVFIPVITIGELYYGACKSGNRRRNIEKIEEFASRSAILVCDESTARYYGRIKDGLRAKGKPLPENDIWIAALACQHRLKLITRDSHFMEIESVKMEPW